MEWNDEMKEKDDGMGRLHSHSLPEKAQEKVLLGTVLGRLGCRLEVMC